jgi:hypothetical protein
MATAKRRPDDDHTSTPPRSVREKRTDVKMTPEKIKGHQESTELQQKTTTSTTTTTRTEDPPKTSTSTAISITTPLTKGLIANPYDRKHRSGIELQAKNLTLVTNSSPNEDNNALSLSDASEGNTLTPVPVTGQELEPGNTLLTRDIASMEITLFPSQDYY